MMRIVLILAAACAALLVILALTRTGPKPQMTAGAPEKAPAVEQAAKPATTAAPAPKAEAPPPPAPEPVDPTVADDAAAVGMTTREPPADTSATPGETTKEKK